MVGNRKIHLILAVLALTLSGFAADNATVIRLRNALAANAKFSEVGTKTLTITADAGSKTGEKSFTMSFNFIAAE